MTFNLRAAAGPMKTSTMTGLMNARTLTSLLRSAGVAATLVMGLALAGAAHAEPHAVAIAHGLVNPWGVAGLPENWRRNSPPASGWLPSSPPACASRAASRSARRPVPITL